MAPGRTQICVLGSKTEFPGQCCRLRIIYKTKVWQAKNFYVSLFKSSPSYLNIGNTFDTKIIVWARFTRENSVWLWADKIVERFLYVHKKIIRKSIICTTMILFCWAFVGTRKANKFFAGWLSYTGKYLTLWLWSLKVGAVPDLIHETGITNKRKKNAAFYSISEWKL